MTTDAIATDQIPSSGRTALNGAARTATPTATLDVRGLWCPLPPLRTLAALKTMQPGEVLEVLGTNPVGNKVAPWVAQRLGNQLIGHVRDEGGFHRFYFEKS